MNRLWAIASAAAFTISAMGQSFNIDIDLASGPGAGVPASSFGAAADQAGFWNAVSTPNVAVTLKSLAGDSTTATLQFTGASTTHSFDDVNATNDYAKLMEDTRRLNSDAASMTFTFQNLEPAYYHVYIYGADPANVLTQTQVVISGQAANVGGAHGLNEFSSGNTHSTHIVQSNGVLTVQILNAPFPGRRGTIAGIQLQKLPSRLYVNAAAASNGSGLSWGNPIKEITAAIDRAGQYGDAIKEIWVAAGAYKTSNNNHPDEYIALGQGLAVYGGFIGNEVSLAQRGDPSLHPTIFSGELGAPGPNDNALRVVTINGGGPDTILDGVTITGGAARMPDYRDYGGGLYITDSTATIRNCRFIMNSAMYGGAIGIETSSPRIENCYFFGNEATENGGAIVSFNFSSPVIVDCDFLQNDASFHGGALMQYSIGTVYAYNCRFLDNSAVGGGGAYIDQSHDYEGNTAAVFGNCVFAANTAEELGGACMVNDATTSATFRNCTIFGNHAPHVAAGIGGESQATITIRNSIVFGNTTEYNDESIEDRQLYFYTGALVTISRSDVQAWSGQFGGVGNFSAIPLFTDADGVDNVLGTLDDEFHLLPGSPCIDRGDNNQIGSDFADVNGNGNIIEPLPLDLDGAPRRTDDPATPDQGAGAAPIVDLGAYEFGSACDLTGDLDGDGDVDVVNLATLLAHYGFQTGMTYANGDLDGDGDVDIIDLSAILSAFGQTCP